MLNDGKTYEGEVDQEKLPHGNGTSYYLNGNVEYRGNYQSGKKSGKGVLYYELVQNLKAYDGEFDDDQMNGDGIMYYENHYNQPMYKGTFERGKYKKGTFYDQEGNILAKMGVVSKKKEKIGKVLTSA